MYTRAPGETVPMTHDGTALSKYLRVKWSGTALSACSATELGVGTLRDPVLSGDTKVAVVPRAGGAKKFVAAGAFAVGADIYGAAGGKVDDTTGGGQVPIGIALEAATADGDIVEVLELTDTQVAA